MFSKGNVHQPYDCAIDFFLGTTPPLSIVEQAAMEEYVQEVLQQGYIRPSVSLASASFSFVEKKGEGLLPLHRLQRAKSDQGQVSLPASTHTLCS